MPQRRARLGLRSQIWTPGANRALQRALGTGGGWVGVGKARPWGCRYGTVGRKREVTGNDWDDVKGRGRRARLGGRVGDPGKGERGAPARRGRRGEGGGTGLCGGGSGKRVPAEGFAVPLEPTCICVNLSTRLTPPSSPLPFHRFADVAPCPRRAQTGHLSWVWDCSTELPIDRGRRVNEVLFVFVFPLMKQKVPFKPF